MFLADQIEEVAGPASGKVINNSTCGASSTLMFIATSGTAPSLYIYDVSSSLVTLSASTGTFNAAGACQSGSSLVAIGTTGATQYVYNYATNILTSGTVSSGMGGSTYPQQIASFVPLNQAVAITGSTPIIRWNGLTMTNVTLSISEGTRCIINRPGSARWLIGTTTTPKVYEIDFSGTIQKTITLPTTPNDGTTVHYDVTGLSMWGDYLLVATSLGILFHYQYSTSTLLNRYYLQMPSGGGFHLTDAINGVMAVCADGSGSDEVIGHTIALFDITSNPIIMMDDILINDQVNKNCTGLSLYAFGQTSKLSYSNNDGRVFLIPALGLFSATVATRSQDPAGTDVGADIIRIRKNPSGIMNIESSQTVASGSVNLPANNHGYEYYEIARKGSGGGEKYDVRKFEA